MKEVLKDYINEKIKYDKKKIIIILSFVIAISGFVGWLYEFIFYYFNFGMEHFYWRGGNFLPWINIYAIGAILILICTHKIKKHPLLVFLVSMLVTGILEYISGWAILEFLGKRFWNYNVEILNFGNINGFICLRSVLIFGISALFLVYGIVPFIIKMINKFNNKKLMIIGLILVSIIFIDEFYNLVISNVFNLPNAIDVYGSLGFNIMERW